MIFSSDSRRIYGLHTFALCLLMGSPAAHGDATLNFDTVGVQAAVEKTMKDRDIPGCTVGIVVGDELVYAHAFGVANVSTKAPMQVETLFQIGSVTKTFTATLMGVLRDRGKIRFDDPVSKYLPDTVKVPAHPLGRPLTLRDLATHTSGLPGNPPNRRDVPDSPSVMESYSIKELYEGLPRTVLISPPGKTWSYSNYGFGLLGHVLEQAEGKSYEELLKEHIFGPWGLKHTRIAISDQDAERLASHCWPRDNPRVARTRWIFGEVCAFGGIISNLPDMARYVSAQMRSWDEKNPISPATLQECQTPQRFMNDNRWDSAQGLGWFIRRNEDMGLIVHHGGEVDGHSAMITFAPRHGVGVIVLSIVGADSAETIGTAVMAVVGKPVAQQEQLLEKYHETKDWTNLHALSKAITNHYAGHARGHYELGFSAIARSEFQEGAQASIRAAQLGYQPSISWYNAACGFARQGNKDEAFVYLRMARAAGLRDWQQALTDPDLESLRSDPRWEEMLSE